MFMMRDAMPGVEEPTVTARLSAPMAAVGSREGGWGRGGGKQRRVEAGSRFGFGFEGPCCCCSGAGSEQVQASKQQQQSGAARTSRKGGDHEEEGGYSGAPRLQAHLQ